MTFETIKYSTVGMSTSKLSLVHVWLKKRQQ